jgi:hypothetical protein
MATVNPDATHLLVARPGPTNKTVATEIAIPYVRTIRIVPSQDGDDCTAYMMVDLSSDQRGAIARLVAEAVSYGPLRHVGWQIKPPPPGTIE